MRILKVAIFAIGLGLTSFTQAKDTETTQHQVSKYAGEENRAIKSLSDSDIEELKNGSGWGLAKAAELNGVPGPAHLLEMQNELGLNGRQTAQIQQLFDQMQAEAMTTGRKLIEQEKLLDERFKSDIPSSTELEELLNEIGATRSKLRFVHLDTHLKTPDILSAEQIKKYIKLRGYSNDDPCENIPEGHSVEMWKKHNNCD